MDKSKYPTDWDDISRRIRERAHNRCEQCGAPNHAWIIRSNVNPARYIIFDKHLGCFTTTKHEVIRMSEIPCEFEGKEIKVVLTVHHVGATKPDGTPGDRHDKMDCRDENLLALCQRCHFIADLDIHRQKALIAIQQKKTARLEAAHQAVRDAGQLELFE
jgi:hypothetical protein